MWFLGLPSDSWWGLGRLHSTQESLSLHLSFSHWVPSARASLGLTSGSLPKPWVPGCHCAWRLRP